MCKIRKSNRLDEDGERKLIDPAAYPEDWDLLYEVIEKSYPLADGSGRHMQVNIIGCDSGGAAAKGNAPKDSNEPIVSVTANAYSFWRRLRDDPEGRGYHNRFHLLKGQPSNSAPTLHKTFPDSNQRDRFAIARGDVPVWFVNSNLVKDRASARLGRTESGGVIRFPIWYDESGAAVDIDWLYSQLTTEVSTAKGWINPSRRKNEAWDLLCYCIALCLHPDIRVEHLDWGKPPTWAAPWDDNSMVFLPSEGLRFGAVVAAKRSLADLALEMG
jgi:phage terminase large subunit GpA-like protein